MEPIKARFLARPNRFTALVELPGGRIERAHVADPGRLEKLLFEGNEILVVPKQSGKYRFRLLAARMEDSWVLLDSRLHNDLAQLILPNIPYLSASRTLRREVRLLNARVDFSLNGYLLEVKGCTLLEDRIAYFPDAPTQRGLRQVKALKAHGKAGLLFLVMAEADLLGLNYRVDPAFSRGVASSDLDLFAYAFRFNADSMAVEPLGLVPVTREEEAEAVLPFLAELREAVEHYNRSHGPEAHYDIIEVNEHSFVLALTGYASCSCCLFDYIEDIIYEAGLKGWRVASWRENRGHFLVRYECTRRWTYVRP